MGKFFDRIACAFRVLFGGRVIVVEVTTWTPPPIRGIPTPPRDAVTMWGTIHDEKRNAEILEHLLKSIKYDLGRKEMKRITSLEKQKN